MILHGQEARVAERVRAAASRVDVDPSELEFGEVITTERDDHGVYVTDLDETVRYYLVTGDIRAAPETIQWQMSLERADLGRFPEDITAHAGERR